jgi:N-acetylglucosamine kinase-like BadF-type ATPase
MDYILGIDQGGTKTIAAVCDIYGDILGTGVSGGACYVDTGLEYSMKMVEEAAGKALTSAGIEKQEVVMLAAGMTGADWPHEYPMFQKALAKTTGVSDVKVVNDCIPALRAGTEKNFGVILCAGSGMNAGVIDQAGNEFVYGYYIDDEDQGAFALGKKAVREAIASGVGLTPSTVLLEEVLKYFSLSNADDLLFQYVNGKLSMVAIKDFVPRLFAIAYEGDAVALGMIKDYGRRISRYAVAGIERFNMQNLDVEVVLSGSVFKNHNPVLIDSVTMHIHTSVPKAIIRNAEYEPVVGALIMGLECWDQGPIASDVRSNIKKSARLHGLNRLQERER